MDRKDKRRFWSDLVLNNALYIVMLAFLPEVTPFWMFVTLLSVIASGGLDEIYRNFLGTPMFYMVNTPIPLYVLYAVFLTALMWLIWNKTTFGKNMFAVGSNPEAANVSCVNVFLTMLGVSSSSLYIIKGAIILCACALDMRKYLVKK